MADYLDGALAPAKRARFDAHLDGCESCSTEFAELRATVHLLRSLPEPQLPPHLADDALRRIRSGDLGGSRFEGFSRRLREIFRELAAPGIAVPVTALTAACALAIVGDQFRLPSLDGARSGASIERETALLAPIPPEAQALAQRVFGEGGLDVPAAFRGSESFAPLPASPRRVVSAVRVRTGGGLARPQPLRAPLSLGLGRAASGTAPNKADDWLEVLLERPQAFATVQASLSVAAREHWVRALGRRAAERGIADQVVKALRDSGRPEALSLARAIAAEAGLPSSQIAAPAP
jgi:hypothetical protein